ncbi:MAG: hypothetical protein JST04_11505 [Bdellovibrionales bacterium]|nr:hypothetical protein [Bdellovibrionales bacterium]
MRPSRLRIAIFFAAAGAFGGCTTSRVVLDEKEFVARSSVDFETVRFRRPETPLFDREAPAPRVKRDAAGNVIVDEALPLGTLDCERSENFFGRLNLAAVRSCLASIAAPFKDAKAKAKPFEIQWGLRKEGQPTLEILDPQEAPDCLRASLGKIPFPRELVYVVASENPEQGECYTSRLALDSGELLGWELPRAKIRLRVKFPLRESFHSDREIERMLRAWTLSLYRGGSREGGEFHGRFLPTRYCLKCMGLPESPERGAPIVPPPTSLWPSRGEPESVRWGPDPNS